jgi:hypothetical protein
MASVPPFQPPTLPPQFVGMTASQAMQPLLARMGPLLDLYQAEMQRQPARNEAAFREWQTNKEDDRSRKKRMEDQARESELQARSDAMTAKDQGQYAAATQPMRQANTLMGMQSMAPQLSAIQTGDTWKSRLPASFYAGLL